MKLVYDDKKCDYHLELSTGRLFDPHLGIVGITPVEAKETGYGSVVYGGFDDPLDHEIEEWTPAERVELADFMIEQWRAFRQAVDVIDARLQAEHDDGYYWYFPVADDPPDYERGQPMIVQIWGNGQSVSIAGSDVSEWRRNLHGRFIGPLHPRSESSPP